MRSFIVITLMAISSSVLAAQAPPIKMGLWEKSMVTTGATATPMTIKSKSCITPAEWQTMTQNAFKPHDGCTINPVKTAKGFSFTGTCNTAGVTLTMSGSETILDSEHITAESHSTSTRKGQTHQIDSHSTSRFLSASCGAIKPGEPEAEP